MPLRYLPRLFVIIYIIPGCSLYTIIGPSALHYSWIDATTFIPTLPRPSPLNILTLVVVAFTLPATFYLPHHTFVVTLPCRCGFTFAYAFPRFLPRTCGCNVTDLFPFVPVLPRYPFPPRCAVVHYTTIAATLRLPTCRYLPATHRPVATLTGARITFGTTFGRTYVPVYTRCQIPRVVTCYVTVVATTTFPRFVDYGVPHTFYTPPG